MDKDWYKSVTLWGMIVGAIAFGLQILGVNISGTEQAQLANTVNKLATGIGELISLIMIIIGRVRAGKQIVVLRSQVKMLSTKAITEGDAQFPKNFIWFFEKIFGTEANAYVALGMFLLCQEGKKLKDAFKNAMNSEKGKLLMEQLNKLT